MNITVNGERRVVGEIVVADLLPSDPAGMAVAVNGCVVPRAEHVTARLTDGDVVEIVTAVQGG